MIAGNLQKLLAGLVGLFVALASGSAVAAIITPDAFLQLGSEEVLVQPVVEDLLASAECGETAIPAAPQPSAPENDRDDPRTPLLMRGLEPAAGTAAGPSFGSHSTGGGPSNSAIAVASTDLPQATLQTALPKEARPYLPTGPPFELLRPPRWSRVL